MISKMSQFNVVSVIEAKSRGDILPSADIRNFVRAVYEKNVDEAQIGAFLMAVKIQGMDHRETADLTRSMVEFSEKFDWSEYEWKNKVVDKHSTGGVGDKISHILAPILAACGLKVPMISGRGLGITGGTIDKLEAIKGYSPTLNIKDLGYIIDQEGLFIIGQTEDMVPVDRSLYAIRDITATVASVPLITASILCKKKIEDLQVLLMDIKYGKGGFMKTCEEGEVLARSMIDTGKALEMKVVCVLDNMDSPLGYSIGNAIEIAEVLRALNGKMSGDLEEIVYTMVYQIMKSIDEKLTKNEATEKIENVLRSGKALEHLKSMLMAQGVTRSLAESLCEHRLKTMEEYVTIMERKSALETEIKAEESGYIRSIDAEIVGTVVRDLKGGRYRKEDRLDYSAGIQLYKKEACEVKKGEPWAKIFHKEALSDSMLTMIKSAVKVTKEAPQKKDLITKILY